MANERSAGAILLSVINSQPNTLLIEHRNNTYVFPKGHIEATETPEEAALREIREETGFTKSRLGRRLGVVTRRSDKADGAVVLKDIIMFIAFAGDEKREPHGEESARWFLLDEAASHLRYPEDRIFLAQHLEELKQKLKRFSGDPT